MSRETELVKCGWTVSKVSF